MLFGLLLRHLITQDRLCVIDAHGTRHDFGDTQAANRVTIRLHSPALHWQLFFNPDLRFGEAYMDGTLTVEEGTLEDLLDIVFKNIGTGPLSPLQAKLYGARRLIKRQMQNNSVYRSKRNVAHHYDLSDALYDSFLDPQRQYSCGYFERPDDTLDMAQYRKMAHLAAKLALEPGMRVLDIGSGWGGLALFLARRTGAAVHGVTLSEEQLSHAQAWSQRTGLADRVSFALADYRTLDDRFDRIISVGMFEHVGVAHYGTFFDTLQKLLTPDGVAVLHTIGRSGKPGVTSQWINKYIFPGGYTPALSEIVSAVERSGLLMTDIEVWRYHYAETLRHWRRRFQKQWPKLQDTHDERFRRMWEFYLTASEMAFRHQDLVVYQIQLAKNKATLPSARNYIHENEQILLRPPDDEVQFDKTA